MIANSSLLTRFDDISGEHGRNIGHAEHGKGSDIDLFQYLTLNAMSGTANYAALVSAADKAVGTGTDAAAGKATVAQWIAAQRAGVDALFGSGAGPSLFSSGLGFCTSVLPMGWLQTAMETGSLPIGKPTIGPSCALPGATSVDLGLGQWTPPANASLKYKYDHNNHNHLGLMVQ
jgi:hypothetical protein